MKDRSSTYRSTALSSTEHCEIARPKSMRTTSPVSSIITFEAEEMMLTVLTSSEAYLSSLHGKYLHHAYEQESFLVIRHGLRADHVPSHDVIVPLKYLR